MNKSIRVMGIESSCDETSVTIVEKKDNKIKYFLTSLNLKLIFTNIMEASYQS